MDVADEYRHLLCIYKKAEDLLHSLGIETGEGIDTTASTSSGTPGVTFSTE